MDGEGAKFPSGHFAHDSPETKFDLAVGQVTHVDDATCRVNVVLLNKTGSRQAVTC